MSDPSATKRIRGVSVADEQRIAVELRGLVDQIPTMLAQHEVNYQRPSVDGSQMDLDNRATNPHQTITAVQTCLNQATDALRALETLTKKPDGGVVLYQSAQYPLIRTIMEASSQAVWLMAPADQRDRIVRALSVIHSEAAFDNAMVQAMGMADPGDGRPERSLKNGYFREQAKAQRAKNANMRRIANPFQITAPEYSSPMSFAELVSSAAEVLGMKPSLTRATWHIISGLTHPSTSRVAMASVVEEVAGDPGTDKNLFSVLMTSDVRIVNFAMTSAVRMLMGAEAMALEKRGLIPALDI